jgi:Cdc6-like AAA superfamily ATPase
MSYEADKWTVLKGEIQEVFSPGAPIREIELFSGRTEQIDQLIEAVRQNGKHAVVFGDPGVGKTSFANTFGLGISSISPRIVAIKINCQPEDTFSSLWKRVFKRLQVAYTQNGQAVTRTVADEYAGEIQTDDVQYELGNFSANISPVIILDEFNIIEDRNLTLQIAKLIKDLSDYSIKCTIVLVGIAEDVTDLIEGYHSVIRQLSQIPMPRMSMVELQTLLLSRTKRLDMKLSEDLSWQMSFLSRGMPYFAHLLGQHSAISACNRRSMKIEQADFDAGIESSLKEVDQILKTTYVDGTMSRKDDTIFEPVLLACALAEADELGRFAQKSVEEPLAAIIKTKRYKSTTYAFHMNEFCTDRRKRILQNVAGSAGNNPRYRFREPLMQPYVILRGIAKGAIPRSLSETLIPPRQASLFPNA